jgi:hypothetical protein
MMSIERSVSGEKWTQVVTDGQGVVAGSERGAVARRRSDGTWATWSVFSTDVTGIALTAPAEIWVASSTEGLAHFNGTQWTSAAPPAGLVSVDALAREGNWVYVGGTDAAGVARVFRQLREFGAGPR